MRNIALILLGGKGRRMGNDIPKQFIEKNGVPIYIYSIFNYENVSSITDIVLVTSKDYFPKVKEDIEKFKITKVRDIVEGGSERFVSSYFGIKRCFELFNYNDNILIADAVRPNTSSILILANIFALEESPAVLTAIKGSYTGERIDTIHKKGNTSYLAQTPQSFKLGYIHDLYEAHILEDDFFPFDDINVVELSGENYDIVEGERENYKITTMEDLKKFLK